jgi:putative heme-binding domain-containing protein
MKRHPIAVPLLALLLTIPTVAVCAQAPADHLFARDNLIAWCIVPFDAKARGPEDRAAMLERLGFKHFAYDWRGEHIPTFDAELDALKRHGIALDAFWVAPGELSRESTIILDVLKRHGVKADLWALLDLGPDKAGGAEQERRITLAASKLRPLAEAAKAIGCRVALYNHGGWFGEPENQVAIIERLKAQGIENVGIVYNLHHGHAHIDRLPALLAAIKPYVWTINLNGMDRDGESKGRKILPLGQGECDLAILRIIRDSGYRGPIGILGHTQDDAEARLRDNLDGLDWLVPQLDGKSAGPRPRPRTPVPGGARTSGLNPAETQAVARLIADARSSGDAKHGADVFASTRFACLSCHKVGDQGGTVGPDLSIVGACSPPEHLAASLLWPKQEVFPGYEATAVETKDGLVLQGYKQAETAKELMPRAAWCGCRDRISNRRATSARSCRTVWPTP